MKYTIGYDLEVEASIEKTGTIRIRDSFGSIFVDIDEIDELIATLAELKSKATRQTEHKLLDYTNY